MPSNICRYLTALIAEGSFSKAAQRLGISQPSLSQFLVRLETEAQTELVDRSAKPLKLTAAGSALFAYGAASRSAPRNRCQANA